jgi:hypothetical protein
MHPSLTSPIANFLCRDGGSHFVIKQQRLKNSKCSHFNFDYFFPRTFACNVAQYNAAGQISIARSALLLPALLGRQADHVHQVHLSGPPETDVQFERYRQDRRQSGNYLSIFSQF